jgi:predicted lipoprotein with Yx(FWY)xxD motif
MELRLSRLLVVAVALLGAPLAVAGAATTAPTVSAAKNSTLGEILVGTGGRTLYDTTADAMGKVACTGSCVARWLPLVVAPHDRPLAGRGVVASRLGTVLRPDGRKQVTYRGHPLYLFSGDARAGQVNGQGLHGKWYALAPSGAAVTTSPSGSSAGASTMPTQPTGSTGDAGSTSTGSGPPPGANVGMWCAANPSSCVNGVPVPGSH